MKSMTKELCSNKVFDFNYLPCKAPIPKKSGKSAEKYRLGMPDQDRIEFKVGINPY
jgi:hypothetical protein